MPSAFHGINMASTALRGFQRGLDTIGHNIANVNTEGYSRQRVEFGANRPLDYYSMGWRTLGNGVSLIGITRIRDMYVEASARHSAGNLAKYQTATAGLQAMDAIYGEPSDDGISAALDRFFDAWSGLGSDPNNSALRLEVQTSGSNLTRKVRTAYADLGTVQAQTQKDVESVMNRIDELSETIAQLNVEIRKYTAGSGSPNDLLDQRDAAVAELSGLVDVSVETWADGSYAVYSGGTLLVDSAGQRDYPRTYDAAAGTVSDSAGTFSVRGGVLAGLFQVLNEVSNQRGQLDSLANTLRTEFNTLHATGTNSLGATGVNFFNDAVPQSGAIDFDLDVAILASPDAIAAGVSGNPGDGGLALALSQMRDTSLGALGNRSFSDFFRSVVDTLAGQAKYFETVADTEAKVAEQIRNRQHAVAGVSLDDEMADMLKFQRSYQAAAKALTVFDQVTEDLINMLRR